MTKRKHGVGRLNQKDLKSFVERINEIKVSENNLPTGGGAPNWYEVLGPEEGAHPVAEEVSRQISASSVALQFRQIPSLVNEFRTLVPDTLSPVFVAVERLLNDAQAVREACSFNVGVNYALNERAIIDAAESTGLTVSHLEREELFQITSEIVRALTRLKGDV